MTRSLVGYATGSRKGIDEDTAQQWAASHGYAMMLWRRDGKSLRNAPVEERHRLHQALFCLRAGFADALWLPGWDHLGDLTTRELVCAEVWANGCQVIVEGQVIDPDGAVPAEQRMLRDLARTGARLRHALCPRQDRHDEKSASDPDIGFGEGEWETARLAHKLREDFQLTLEQIADFLTIAGYLTATGKLFTPGSIKHLLDKYKADLWSRSSEDLHRQDRSSYDDLFLVAYGSNTEEFKSAAEAYNTALDNPCGHLVVIDHADIAGDSAEGTGLDPVMRKGLHDLLVLAPFAGSVYARSAEAFGSPVVRELVYAQLWQAGTTVVVDGVPVDSANRADSVTAALRPAARSGARLHAALRAHDSATVIGNATSLRTARMLAQTLRDNGRTLLEIAHHLNDEAIPTRKLVGFWSTSAVSELLT